MKLSALVQKERSIQVRVGEGDGDIVNVTYAPGRITLAMADAIQAAAAGVGGGEMKAIEAVLVPVLVSWDLEEDDGSLLPCDGEGLKRVPMEFLGMLMSAITEDSRPDPTKAGTSEDGSAPEEHSADAQNGTQSSQPQGSLV